MKRSDRAAYALLVVLVVYAAWRATSRAWTCDDAFISFRYADNLVRGLGLVWNTGEAVEGYTNFLYTVAIAGGVAAGASPIPLSHAIGIVSYFAVAAVLVVWSRRRRKRDAPWIPLGACLWLVQDDLHTWATGGLETTMFAAFALGGMAMLAIPSEPKRAHSVIGGTLLALACTVRPDGVLFALVGLAAPFVVRPRERTSAAWRELVAIAIPLAVIGGAFVAFKMAYYGRLLPTAFHAKSASDARWEQGLVYVGLYFGKYWSTALAAIALPIVAVVHARGRKESGRRDAWLAGVAFTIFTLYVVRSSGDYMFARRLVPALPFLFVALDGALDVIDLRAHEHATAGIAAAVIGGTLLPYPVLPDEPGARVAGVGDERLFYPPAVIEMRKAQAAVAKDVFAREHVRAGFGGGMCMFAYFSGLPDLVEPNGLTQYWIAEEGADEIGRIGHKGVSKDWLRAHGVRLIFHNDPPPIPPSDRFDDVIVSGILRIEILSYDEALMERLAADPRVKLKRVGDVLREAEDDVKQMPCDDARATHEALRPYWLAAHPEEDVRFRRVVDDVCAQGR